MILFYVNIVKKENDSLFGKDGTSLSFIKKNEVI